MHKLQINVQTHMYLKNFHKSTSHFFNAFRFITPITVATATIIAHTTVAIAIQGAAVDN